MLILGTAGSVLAQNDPDWSEPLTTGVPHVGKPVLRRRKGLANYLSPRPEGNILINSDLERMCL